MNTAEKIAYTYLRLNGFCLLPQFTVFGGGAHNHVDLIGLRAANSSEQLGEFTFPIDDAFFHLISEIVGDPLNQYLGVVAEVRTNADRIAPNDNKVEYVRRFLGEAPAIRLAFYDDDLTLHREADLICICVRYALHWIVGRIEWMEQRMTDQTKIGSWTWSDECLSDILVLCRYGFLGNDR